MKLPFFIFSPQSRHKKDFRMGGDSNLITNIKREKHAFLFCSELKRKIGENDVEIQKEKITKSFHRRKKHTFPHA